MIKVLEEEIKEKSYSMVLQHVDYDDDEVEVALKLVKEKRLRGIIFLGGYLVHSEEKLAQLHVPFILRLPECCQRDSVVIPILP